MHAPDGKQVDHAPAADVDDVLLQQAGADVDGVRGQAEQRQVRRLAVELEERAVEALDLLVGIAAGGRQQADAWLDAAREVEHVTVERRVSRRGREAPAPHRDEPARVRSRDGAREHRIQAAMAKRCTGTSSARSPMSPR